MAFEFVASELAERRAASLFRQRQVVEQTDGRTLVVNGRQYLNFSSNDYLGLAHSDALKQVATEAAQHWSTGSGASALVTGHSLAHAELEDYLAERLERERVLLFNSGFAANQALIQTLMQRGGSILADKLCHASMLDGALASGAKLQRFAHNDMTHLASLLQKAQGDTLVMSEGVFSMDGDVAPLEQLSLLGAQHEALLYVDDAHGFGVSGHDGLGVASQWAQPQLPLLMATFGKAVGTSGAFLAVPDAIYAYLVNYARHYIYSTAMSPLLAAITLGSLKLIDTQAWRRDKLNHNIQFFRHLAGQQGLPLMASQTAIQPLLIGDAKHCMALASKLREQGMWLTPIRPPTVPPASSRLRITISAAHTEADINQLIQTLVRGMTHVG